MTAKKSNSSSAKPKPAAKLVSSMVPRRRVQTEFTGESLTEQAHASECNINAIMSRFMKSGQITHLNHRQPHYGYAPANDFRESIEIVKTAEEGFDALPADFKEKFGDPAGMLEFFENPDNLSEMADMGFLTPEATQAMRDSQKAAQRPAAQPDGNPAPNSDASPPPDAGN